MVNKRIAIYALTAKGAELGILLRSLFDADLFVLSRYCDAESISFRKLSEIFPDNFKKYDSHVFISACGIVVRSIAPLLESKLSDPAVVVIDQQAKFVISLLSGHLGGANELTEKIAAKINAQAVITTATDVSGLPSIDLVAKESGLYAVNPAAFKHVSSAVLDGEDICIYDPHEIFCPAAKFPAVRIDSLEDFTRDKTGIYIGTGRALNNKKILCLHPESLYIGIGCRRGASETEIMELLTQVLSSADLSCERIVKISSVDLKKNEAGLLAVAKKLGVETAFYSPEDLETQHVESPSDFVLQTVGVASVCEAAALKSSGGKLIIGKRKTSKVTVAVAVKC
ncbi:cobalt-precorrin 5A hydrolase [Maridesulfovibrio bastinii]|uniref:cobalt-precorrin 5A hydrolase n=1 Tax=Maridesulfovibrio bastinii TaxID=47157 RepID=UPI00042480BE|nr:cobalt-precorrin 5A hydrolase [Maridesulfovibrio bastinii]